MKLPRCLRPVGWMPEKMRTAREGIGRARPTAGARSDTVRVELSRMRFELGSIDRMTVTISPDATSRPRLIGEAPAFPSRPAPHAGAPLNLPPALAIARDLTALHFTAR